MSKYSKVCTGVEKYTTSGVDWPLDLTSPRSTKWSDECIVSGQYVISEENGRPSSVRSFNDSSGNNIISVIAT